MTTEPTEDQMRTYQAEQRANAAHNLARDVAYHLRRHHSPVSQSPSPKKVGF